MSTTIAKNAIRDTSHITLDARLSHLNVPLKGIILILGHVQVVYKDIN